MRLSQIVNLGASREVRPPCRTHYHIMCFIMCCMLRPYFNSRKERLDLLRKSCEMHAAQTPPRRAPAGPRASGPATALRAGRSGVRSGRVRDGKTVRGTGRYIGLISPIGPSREIVLPCPTRYQTAYHKTTHPDLGLIAPGFLEDVALRAGRPKSPFNSEESSAARLPWPSQQRWCQCWRNSSAKCQNT